ncbi:hypothetical protein XELAEV_180000833mg, partial [Xenopus laevis]
RSPLSENIMYQPFHTRDPTSVYKL